MFVCAQELEYTHGFHLMLVALQNMNSHGTNTRQLYSTAMQKPAASMSPYTHAHTNTHLTGGKVLSIVADCSCGTPHKQFMGCQIYC